MSCEYAHSIFTLFQSVIINSDNCTILKLSRWSQQPVGIWFDRFFDVKN